MPEILTKNPEMLLNILKGAGFQCGNRTTQQAKTECPKDQFCALPTGEICVYGVQDVSRMSQIQLSDFVFPPAAIFSFITFSIVFTLLGTWIGTKLR